MEHNYIEITYSKHDSLCLIYVVMRYILFQEGARDPKNKKINKNKAGVRRV